MYIALALGLAVLSSCGGQSGNNAKEKIYVMDTVGFQNYSFHLETQPVDSGFGYLIAVNGKKMILQDIVPAVGGYHAFTTEEDAFRVGQIVIRKMAADLSLPSVTVEELVELGISDEYGNFIK